MPEWKRLKVTVEVEFTFGVEGPDNHAKAVQQATARIEAVEGAQVASVRVCEV